MEELCQSLWLSLKDMGKALESVNGLFRYLNKFKKFPEMQFLDFLLWVVVNFKSYIRKGPFLFPLQLGFFPFASLVQLQRVSHSSVTDLDFL